MYLHTGDNKIINEKKIVMIINANNESKNISGVKSIILLTDGSRHNSPINAATLKRRMENINGFNY